MPIQIIYHGHSCFSIINNGYHIVVDPYEDYVPGYATLQLSANQVLCSHDHRDHNHREAVTLLPPTVISPFDITAIRVPHDDHNGELRGMNLIHLFSCQDMHFAHLGDIGCLPGLEILDKLTGLDAVMIPIGGTYTINSDEALQLLNIIKPKVAIPMHYRSGNLGFEVLDTPQQFSTRCSKPVFYQTNCFILDSDTPEQTAFLTYQL